MGLLAAMLAAGCFEDPVRPVVPGDGTASGSGTTAGTSSPTTTEPGPTTDTDPTTAGTTQSSLDDTGTESSSGEPLPIECGDGLAVPGELCFGDTTVVMANDATFGARIGDVAGTSSGDLVHLIPDQVVVRVGDGDGNFGPAVFDASVVAQRFELADFDGDGELDLAVPESAGTLRLLLGSGAGSFAPSGQASVGSGPQALAVGDLDDDGDLDLVVGAGSDLHAVLGDGAGGLSPLPPVTSFGPVTGLALADVDGDGRLDLAIAVDGGGWQGVALRRGVGDGTFEEQEATAGQRAGARGVVTGDFDGDGSTDVAYLSTTSDALGVLLGDGGGLGREVVVSTGTGPSALLADDLDHDGHEDLVVGHQGETTLRVFRAGPGGRVTEGLQVPLAAPVSALGSGHLDDDGVPDLAATSSAAEIVTLVLSTP